MTRPEIEALRKQLKKISTQVAVDADPLKAPPPGSLVEWNSCEGSGAATVSLSVVRDVLASRPGVWAVVDASGEFFPAAAWGWGIPLDRTVVIRPRGDEDMAWAVEHCLRSQAVAVTWCHVGRHADRWLRRWKRAAEIGGGLGVLFRSEQSSTGTGIDQRWHSRGGQQDLAGRTVEVGLDYCRGFHEGTFHVQVCDAEGSLTLVPQLAHSATLERAAGA